MTAERLKLAEVTPTSRRAVRSPAPKVRVAIYTRKSVEARGDQAFNSLEAQHDAVMAMIASKATLGWEALPTVFEDNGFTGANTERPGFLSLRAAIEAGEIDVLAVYKLDRVSRSQLDLHTLLGFLKTHRVDLVSATEPFDTTSVSGRAMFGMLATFSQMERETIAERTRDKIAASRRRGMWTGGRPVLGYTLKDKKLVVDEDEATRVRGTFQLYLERGSLLETAKELDRRGWVSKTWTSRDGRTNPGKPFQKPSLQRLLRNPLYIGKVQLKGEVFDGEHEAIVDEDLWGRVQAQLDFNARTRGRVVRNKWGAILKGLLHCARCGAPMGHTYTARGNRRYRYYLCRTAQERGRDACPGACVSAPEIEKTVVAQIRGLGANPELARLTAAALVVRTGAASSGRVATALQEFDALWDALPALQQSEVLHLLISKVELDPESRDVEISFREPSPLDTSGGGGDG